MHFTRVGPSLRTLEEEWTDGTRLFTGSTISSTFRKSCTCLFFLWLICSGPGKFSVDSWLASQLLS